MLLSVMEDWRASEPNSGPGQDRGDAPLIIQQQITNPTVTVLTTFQEQTLYLHDMYPGDTCGFVLLQ